MIINDNGVNRPMTEEEEINFKAWQETELQEAEAKKTEQTEKAAAKSALLERLGITADEAVLLLS